MANTEQFDMNTDYSALMKQAADNKDWASAAKYENLRNQKIDAMNANGTNTGGWTKSDDYKYDNLSKHSYNGSYLNVDTNVDYQAKINEAKANNDYDSMAYYEALRNAKIDYLTSIGQTKPGMDSTTNYVNLYSSNNKGGVSYTSKYNNFNDLPSDWTRANVNGSTYKKESDGNIYQRTGYLNGNENWLLKGSGINPNTGEWTFNNENDAKVAAVNNYLMNNYNDKYYKTNEEAYNALYGNGSINDDYIKNIQAGTFYSSAEKEANRRQEQRAQEFNNGFNNLNSNQQNTIISNSFETDLNSGNSYNANINPYYSGYYGIHYSPYQDWRRQQEYRAYV